ncbi:MAG: ACP S-malonyltransferase, partial [Acholeplasmataceae bacterium]|nr:ACP S-malonyltransferase [Acholeplasmataceae bacterium]
MMGKLAIVFAGQGSQFLGMGLDFASYNQQTQEKLNQASKLLGYDVKHVLLSEHGEMNQTVFTQPLMFLATTFAYDELIKLTSSIEGVIGFSLGEYSAYYASEVFSFENLLKIVKQRAEFMDQTAQKYPGKMAAIMGLDSKIVDEICQSIEDGIVVSANYNSPIQTVISGDEKAVEKACELSKQKGAKRAMLLNVSGAFHSPLMKEAGENLFEYLKDVKPSAAKLPIYLNTTSQVLVFETLKDEMRKQVFSPVLFEQSIRNMESDGFTHF